MYCGGGVASWSWFMVVVRRVVGDDYGDDCDGDGEGVASVWS